MVHGKRHSGVVRNLSAQGLYVEIHAALPLGAAAVVAFRTAEGKLFVLEASVPNQRLIPHSLKLLATGGVGLRLVDPPETYQRWLEGAGESAS
jgi:hypothetical protein